MSRRAGLTRVLCVYNVLLPLLLLVGIGPWVLKMLRRGGFGTGLLERLGVYREDLDFEPCGVVYIHAVSVGEVLIALKLISAWQQAHPEDRIVLAPTTATGHAVAVEKAPAGVRVIYSPVDLPMVVGRMLKRFEPKQIVLVESEVWPNLLSMAQRRGVPIMVANARLSPRSESRYAKLQGVVRPLFALFDRVAVPEQADCQRWQSIGVRPEATVVTGSIKFDQQGAAQPQRRATFQEMLDSFGVGRKVVMALSTHAGEEALIAESMQGRDAVCVLVPRHAERREEVKVSLEKLGYEVVLRSRFHVPQNPQKACLVIDSTGELRDWTAHADLAVIGKSFLGRGGQNPAEAIAAGVPVIAGPSMENFEPLMTMLREANGVEQLEGAEQLSEALSRALAEGCFTVQAKQAKEVLELHQGASARTVSALRVS